MPEIIPAHRPVIVCGGRKFLADAKERIFTVDGEQRRTPPTPAALRRAQSFEGLLRFTLTYLNPTIVYHGDATGADNWAAAIAADMGFPVCAFPADWVTHGNKAGPIRNTDMANAARGGHCIAFPGGHGTGDMVRKVRAPGADIILLDLRGFLHGPG